MIRFHCLLVGLSLLCALAPVRSEGMESGGKYLALRARWRCERKLSYVDVQANPDACTGRVMELQGAVAGTAGSADGVMLLLSLSDQTAVDLTIPATEWAAIQRDGATALRVLVQIGANPNGNVVPLKVLALAADSDVRRVELAEAAKEVERRKQATERERAEARRLLSVAPRATLASRHAPARPAADTRPVAVNSGTFGPYERSLSDRARPLFAPYRSYIVGQNLRLTPPQASEITASLLHFADRYDVDPRLVVAMIMAESHFNPGATSKTGAMGLGQLMPGTARSLGVNNAYDPVQNLGGSIAYLRSRLDTFADHALPGGGMSFEQVRLAMAAYNAGANAVKKYNGVPPYRETQAYVRRIETLYRQLCGQ